MTVADAVPARRTNKTWVVVAIAGIFGLFYAAEVWGAVDFLVQQATGPLGLNGSGWFVLLLAVVFPMAAFGAAFAIGYRRRPWEFALVLLAGLTLSAAFWLNIVAYAAFSGASLLG
jgi:hypothetical protein